VLGRDHREASGAESGPVDQQIQRDDEGQNNVEDDGADLGQGPDQVLEHVGSTLLDGRSRLGLELVDVCLNAVLAERRLHFGRARLQVIGVLRQRRGQVGGLGHEWTS
jgi:hypothetical protein